MDEHQDNGGVAEPGLREEREGVGVVEELVAEGPVDGGGRRNGQREDVERGDQIYVLKLLGLPHCMHDLPVQK